MPYRSSEDALSYGTRLGCSGDEQSARRKREAELLASMDAEPADDRVKGFRDDLAPWMWIDHQAWISR